MWICVVVVVTLGRAESYTNTRSDIENTTIPAELDVEKVETANLSDSTITSEIPDATVQTVGATDVETGSTEEDTSENFSHLVAILHNNFLVGAGAIVGEKWILATAFQLGAFKAAQLTVRVGSASAVSGGQLLSVAQLFPHPMFHKFDNDVALLRTAEAVEPSDSARPIPVAQVAPGMGDGAVLWVWGGGSSAQRNRADILPVSDCKAFYPDFDLTEGNICAVLDHVLPFEVGLFGSPLVYNGTLVGLYMGMEANVYKPSLCSNLPTLVAWVDAMMKNETATQLLFPLL